MDPLPQVGQKDDDASRNQHQPSFTLLLLLHIGRFFLRFAAIHCMVERFCLAGRYPVLVKKLPCCRVRMDIAAHFSVPVRLDALGFGNSLEVLGFGLSDPISKRCCSRKHLFDPLGRFRFVQRGARRAVDADQQPPSPDGLRTIGGVTVLDVLCKPRVQLQHFSRVRPDLQCVDAAYRPRSWRSPRPGCPRAYTWR